MSDLIKKLRSDSIYKEALKAVKDVDDRKKIIFIVESFLSDFENSLKPLQSAIEHDPIVREEMQSLLFNNESEK